MKDLIYKNEFYCPIAQDYFQLSDYLKEVFKDKPKALWLANMVTHYRHYHITWWNKCWGRHGYKYQGNWFQDYDAQKRKVNEQAKRQIIRKCREFMNFHQIRVDDFRELQFNDEKTIQLAMKHLK